MKNMTEGIPADNSEPKTTHESVAEVSRETQENSGSRVATEQEKPERDLGEKIEQTQNGLASLKQSLAGVRASIGVETQGEDPAVVDLEQRLEKLRAEQADKFLLVSENPEFQRLLPGFIEQGEQRPEIKKPLIHGTNSYAFKRIIVDGFVPQDGSKVHNGENVAHRTNLGEGKKNPTSFLEPSKKGDQLSHWYAMIASAKPELAFDSEGEIGNRTQRIVDEVYEGVDKVVEDRFKEETLETHPTESKLSEAEKTEMAREDLRQEILHKVADRMKEGANIFNPKEATEKIVKIDGIINGEPISIEEGEKLFRDLRIVDSIRAMYAPRGNKTPRYQTKEVIISFLAEATNGDGEARQLLMKQKNEIQGKLDAYESLPAEEHEEMKLSFPCFITVEGDGLETVKSNWMHKVVEFQMFDRTEPGRIKRVEVPESKIETVRRWLVDAGLADVQVVPIEYFEMKEVIEHKQ
ncbi:MAG: hypothetical protein Q7S57_04365 [bacterium]|nr:hypothetical protein [bacterium]